MAGINTLHAAGAGPDDRLLGQPGAISFRPRKRRRRVVARLGAEARRQARNPAGNHQCRERSRSNKAARSTSPSTGRRRAGSASRRRRSTTSSMTPSASASSRRSIRNRTNIASSWRRAGSAAHAGGAQHLLSAVIDLDDQRPGAALGHRPCRANGPGRCRSPISASFPRRTSRSTWRPAPRSAPPSRRSRRRKKNSACRRASSRHARQRRGLHRLAQQRGSAHHRRDRDDVYRARRALRELHSSDHDPLHPAVGGRRRASVADPCRRRSRHHRDHRHHSADRHRQEERDHDDRFRARRRAQRRPSAARGDLPGLSPALPADPDDDDGRHSRRPAA